MSALDELLPNEIWIKILEYVSVGDREKHVQFVNKRFYFLCSDRNMTTSISFGSDIFLPNQVCLGIVRKLKEVIQRISFRRCHWFIGSMFSSLPRMNKLQTLDLTGCFLTAVQLLKVLQKTLNLKNLTLSITSEEGIKLAKITNLQFTLCLEALHVHIHFSTAFAFSLLDPADDIKFCSEMFFCNNLVKSVKIFAVDVYYTYRVFRILVTLPYFMVYNCVSADEYSYMKWSINTDISNLYEFEEFRKNISTQSSTQLLKTKCDFTNLRFLALPTIFYDHGDSNLQPASNFKIPIMLSNLECLIISKGIFFTDTRTTCCDIVRRILCDCKFPNLKCLKIGVTKVPITLEKMRTMINWENIFENISSLKYLQEMDLSEIPVDLGFLLKYFAGSTELSSLAVPVGFITENFDDQTQPTHNDFQIQSVEPKAKHSRISRFSEVRKTALFSDLVKKWKKLKKLKIVGNQNATLCASSLDPISQLAHLQLLSITDIPLTGLHHLSAMLKKCSLITSLTLENIGHPQHCVYETLFVDVLKFLPNIHELCIKHSRMQITRRLFVAIASCKNLKRLILVSDIKQHISSTDLIMCIRMIMSQCLCLHTLVMYVPKFPDILEAKVAQYLKILKKEGRNPIIVCDISKTNFTKVDNSSFFSVGSYNTLTFLYLLSAL